MIIAKPNPCWNYGFLVAALNPAVPIYPLGTYTVYTLQTCIGSLDSSPEREAQTITQPPQPPRRMYARASSITGKGLVSPAQIQVWYCMGSPTSLLGCHKKSEERTNDLQGNHSSKSRTTHKAPQHHSTAVVLPPCPSPNVRLDWSDRRKRRPMLISSLLEGT